MVFWGDFLVISEVVRDSGTKRSTPGVGVFPGVFWGLLGAFRRISREVRRFFGAFRSFSEGFRRVFGGFSEVSGRRSGGKEETAAPK